MEGPLLPGVGEADGQDQDKDNYLNEHVQTHPLSDVLAVNRGPRVEKRRLDVEDQEKQREDVVTNRKGTPRVRDRYLAGLVDLALRPELL